jgi:hypothetical protein
MPSSNNTIIHLWGDRLASEREDRRVAFNANEMGRSIA